MLGQPKENIEYFIKLVAMGSENPIATETKWRERLKFIAMNNGEWPTVLKNINDLVSKKKKDIAEILQNVNSLPLKECVNNSR